MSGLNVVVDGLTGDTARVDEKNRLRVFAATRADEVDASVDGDSFFINHSIINLTSDSQSFIFYVKNTDDRIWLVDDLTFFIGTSDGGSGDFTSTFLTNPTGGTLLTAGADAFIFNQNLGDPRALNGTFLSGFEGATATGGIFDPGTLQIGTPTVIPVVTSSPIVFEPGSSLALSVTPPTGNTSMNVQHSMILHRSLD